MAQNLLKMYLEEIFIVFHNHAILEEPRDSLSKGQFSKLLREQLPNFLQASRTLETIDGLFKELDQNGDGQLSFEKFMPLIGKVAIEIHSQCHQVH